MSVSLAKTAGFCFGVERAVQLVRKALAAGGASVCTLGPIIHNERVAEEFRNAGVREIGEDLRYTDSGEEIPPDSLIVIRSHGVTKATKERILSLGHRILDATCPFVSKIHETVARMSLEGRHVVIIGSAHHPEVIGISGWVEGSCTLIETEEDIAALPGDRSTPLGIVAQTTFREDKFSEYVEIIRQLGYDVLCANTICNATKERQSEALELAAQSDMMLVIGGKHSSNTQKLYDICKSRCGRSFYIQGVEDLERIPIDLKLRIGITAGASTPNSIIEEVSSYVRGTELSGAPRTKF